MITLALFYMSRDMNYNHRPSDLYMGTVILDFALIATVFCGIMMFTGNW
ncbi:hypothetical protein [Vibrio phage nt-1]|uniref:Uncharacterized protein n=1 Tax=Vibrio phage nt-1 TaxID=115992 RepID=A0A068JBR1_9CAUD|nr:hypothetical protein [Vibrio phage nt-1]AIE13771.1 hypothetical protein [Vibrio phage nt-1]